MDPSHGVVYKPQWLTGSAPPSIAIEDLSAMGIETVRVLWVDLTNTVRARLVPVEYFKKLMNAPRPGFAVAKVTHGLVYLITAPGFSACGEFLAVPEVETLRLSGYDPKQAVIMTHFEEKGPVNGSLKVDICPRQKLRDVVDNAWKTENVQFLVGFETEFILLESTDPVRSISSHSWTTSKALPVGSTQAKTMEAIAANIRAAGIDLQMYHAEAAPGQFEVVTAPLPPLEAADALVHTREIIFHTAAQQGLHATFAPRVFLDSAGSSAHAHISVHSPDCSKATEELSALEKHFLAGILDHLQALLALTMPTPASYRRVADGCWSGGTYVCWGTENREAPVRLTNVHSPSSRNFELRFVDATANPHLALSAILGTGLYGIRCQVDLGIADIPGPPAALMSEEERQAHGVTKRLPFTWELGRSELLQDKVVQAIFGDDFIEKYLSTNKTLADAIGHEQEDAATLKRLVEYY